MAFVLDIMGRSTHLCEMSLYLGVCLPLISSLVTFRKILLRNKSDTTWLIPKRKLIILNSMNMIFSVSVCYLSPRGQRSSRCPKVCRRRRARGLTGSSGRRRGQRSSRPSPSLYEGSPAAASYAAPDKQNKPSVVTLQFCKKSAGINLLLYLPWGL